MPNGPKNGSVRIPSWIVRMAIPLIAAIGLGFVAVERTKEIPRHDQRIDLLERAAMVQGEDHAILQMIRSDQRKILERLARIEAKLEHQ